MNNVDELEAQIKAKTSEEFLRGFQCGKQLTSARIRDLFIDILKDDFQTGPYDDGIMLVLNRFFKHNLIDQDMMKNNE